MNPDLIDKVLQPILHALESGELPPWAKSWDTSVGSPINAVTGRPYSGANRLLLMIAAMRHGDSRFLGFDQAKKAGGWIKAGSSSIPIILPIFKKMDGLVEGEKIVRLVSFRLGRVFPINCCTGLDPKKIVSLPEPKVHDPIEAAESFIRLQPVRINPGPCPCYIPSLDEIRIPSLNLFKSPESYYSALLHEAGHATGHASRLKRPGIVDFARFGSKPYGEEELLAELFAAFARHELGFGSAPEIQDSSSYLLGWLTAIRETPQMLLTAATQADAALRWWKRETKAATAAEDLSQAEAA